MTVRKLDSEALRTLAHPLRARLLSALRVDGPATATHLARRLGTNTGATSYHLRALAAVDLVAEDTERGTSRERWWRAAQEVHSWLETDLDDPDAQAAASWLRGHYWRQFAEQAAVWEAERDRWPLAWREQTGHGDQLVHVTADELGALVRELQDLVARHHRPERAGAPGVRTVSVHLSALPRHAEHPPEP